MTLRRRALFGVLAALAAAVLAAATDLPRAAAQGTCDGVEVVVDFTVLGGEVEEGCAPLDVTTGLEALQAAGYSYTFVPNIPGMVCQIDGQPDPCNGAPSDAYWGYWVDDGGDWAYATEGAGTRAVSAGDREGWAFGDGDPPGQPTTTRSSGELTAADSEAGAEGASDNGSGAADAGAGGRLLILGLLLLGIVFFWRRRPRGQPPDADRDPTLSL